MREMARCSSAEAYAPRPRTSIAQSRCCLSVLSSSHIAQPCSTNAVYTEKKGAGGNRFQLVSVLTGTQSVLGKK